MVSIEFLCPRQPCDSPYWGTRNMTAPHAEWLGYCAVCNFTWLRVDDWQHFVWHRKKGALVTRFQSAERFNRVAGLVGYLGFTTFLERQKHQKVRA